MGYKKHKAKIWTMVWAIALIGIFIFLSISLVIVLVNPNKESHLSAYQDGWEDLSSMKEALGSEGYETRSILTSISELKIDKGFADHANSTLLVMVGVENIANSYGPSDASALKSFLDDGGRLILADDYGYANELLRMMGIFDTGSGHSSSIKFSGHRLYDPSYEKSPEFVLVDINTFVNDSSYANAYRLGPYTVMLDDPTVLTGVGSSSNVYDEVIATSSHDSWLDSNDNGLWDPFEENKQARSVMALQYVGNEGMIFYVSDPGLFINDMWTRHDNARFIMDMANVLLPLGGRVIFDESQHTHQNPLVDVTRAVHTFMIMLTTGMCMPFLIILALLAASGIYLFRSRGPPQRVPSPAMDPMAIYGRGLAPSYNTDVMSLRELMLETLRIRENMTIYEFGILGKRRVHRLLKRYNDDLLLDLYHDPYGEETTDPREIFDHIMALEGDE